MAEPNSQHLRNRVIDAVERGEMSRRAATRRHEIGESVAIKWLERVERDGPRRSARRMRLAGPPPRGLRPRGVFRRDLALDTIGRSRTLTHVGGVAEDRNPLRRLPPIESDGA
jgi:hypothetical protein